MKPPGSRRNLSSRLSRQPFTARGALTLISGIGLAAAALVLDSAHLFAVGICLTVAAVCSLFIIFGVPGTPHVERVGNFDRISAGDDVEVEVRVTARTGKVISNVLGGDRLDPAFSLTGPAIAPFYRSGPRTLALRYRFRALRRGRYRLGPLQIWGQDALGLVRRNHFIGNSEWLTVLPAPANLGDIAEILGATVPGDSGRSSLASGSSSEDIAARPYVTGDSIRRVNWRATAHRNELMVRQEEGLEARDALIFLDTLHSRWTTPADEPDFLPAFDHAVSLAAAAIAVLAAQSRPVRLWSVNGLDARLSGGQPGAEATRALEDLALIATQDTQDRVPSSPAQAGAPLSGCVVAILGALEPEAAIRIAELGRGLHTAIALFPRGTEPDTLALLRAAGWVCRDAPRSGAMPS